MKTLQGNLETVEDCRALKYENSQEYETEEGEGDAENMFESFYYLRGLRAIQGTLSCVLSRAEGKIVGKKLYGSSKKEHRAGEYINGREGMKKSEVREDILGMAEAFYRRGCEDSAHNIAQEIYEIIERHKNEDWRDLVKVLSKHLQEGAE